MHLNGLDAWFAPEVLPTSLPPSRWRMTVVSWFGIFPTVTIMLLYIVPILAPFPFLIRTALFTGMVAIVMSYLVMPRLTPLMNW